MKKIEAIVRLARFDKVRNELANIGIQFFTMKEVNGFGLQQGAKKMYRGSIYDDDYIARLQVDILAEDEQVEDIVAAIRRSGKTGEVGDGKISVYHVEEVIRIRNGERGANAL
ncbi:MAG: P-II family nitrogen regulator [Bacteroidota bacterium]